MMTLFKIGVDPNPSIKVPPTSAFIWALEAMDASRKIK